MPVGLERQRTHESVGVAVLVQPLGQHGRIPARNPPGLPPDGEGARGGGSSFGAPRALLADVLITQACLDHEVPLVTRNRDFRHFRAAGLRLLPELTPHAGRPFGLLLRPGRQLGPSRGRVLGTRGGIGGPELQRAGRGSPARAEGRRERPYTPHTWRDVGREGPIAGRRGTQGLRATNW